MTFETYQHFKGGIYVKLFEATHTETGEILVIYICAISGQAFSRPKEMFYEIINKDNYCGPRFKRIPNTIDKNERKNFKII